jgi:hypothetical protein
MTRILTIHVLSGALALVVAAPSSADATATKTPKATLPHVVKTPQGGAASPLYGQANNTNETNGPGGVIFLPRPKATPKVNAGTKNVVTVKGAQ